MTFNKQSKIIYLDSISSTNNYAKDLCKKEELIEGTVIFTHHQTLGRGQSDNIWESENGKNLTFSQVLFPKSILPNKQFILSKAISLAVLSFLSKHTQKNIKIKWPNDIYIDNRKISGILIENSLSGNKILNSIIGIGININQVKFNPKTPNPTSLKIIENKTYNIEECLLGIIRELNHWYGYIKNNSFEIINQTYFNNLYLKDKWHNFTCNNVQMTLKIIGINDNGQIILESKSGIIKTFSFKEIIY